MLRELNAVGARAVPAARRRVSSRSAGSGYLADALAAGDTTALPALLGACGAARALRDALRSGDIYVPGSRRYADPTAYLITPEAWSAAARRVLPSGRPARRPGRGA